MGLGESVALTGRGCLDVPRIEEGEGIKSIVTRGREEPFPAIGLSGSVKLRASDPGRFVL